MVLKKIRSYFGIANQSWRDPRVPLLAKIFLIFAPLYWLNPTDVISDLQPGGHVDDVIIAALLIMLAIRLVPVAVFRDAHKAFNPAVCGVMCLSILGQGMLSTVTKVNQPQANSELEQIKCMQHFGPALKSAKKAPLEMSTITVRQLLGSKTLKESTDSQRQNPQLIRISASQNNLPLPSTQVLQVPLAEHWQELVSLSRTRMLPATAARSLLLSLLTRGGHGQLYSGGALFSAVPIQSTQVFSQLFSQSFSLPPLNAGGIFIA